MHCSVCSGYRPPLRWASLDIETDAQGNLYSIAFEGCGQRQVYMLGPPNGEENASRDFSLEYRDSRRELLQALIDWMALHDPDVIIGWNVIQFDLRMLVRLQTAMTSEGNEPSTNNNQHAVAQAQDVTFCQQYTNSWRQAHFELAMIHLNINRNTSVYVAMLF